MSRSDLSTYGNKVTYVLKNLFSQSVNRSKEELLKNGFTFISSEKIKELIDVDDVSAFSHFWDHMPIDEYMSDHGKYRRRKVAKFVFNTEKHQLEAIYNDGNFFQKRTVNSLNGGIVRKFQPVPPEFEKLDKLNNLVKSMLAIISKKDFKTIYIIMHLFRIESNGENIGLPTPEGIHCDGHDYVSQHLIKRNNVIGGVTGVYDQNHRTILHKQLAHSFDTILLNDRKVKHDVTPVFQIDPAQLAYRDILVIDYKFDYVENFYD